MTRPTRTAARVTGALPGPAPAPRVSTANTGEGSGVDSGRKSDFEELYARMARPAFRYATAIAGVDAEDACQEAWLSIWRSWDGSDPGRREAWAFRVVRNAALDRLRRRRPVEPLGDDTLLTVAGVEEVVLTRLEGDAALGALAHLSLPLREALWLREVGDLSYAEVAEVQGVPVGTVMSRLHSARRQVARRMRRGSA
ncbi:MAG: RNA polymerase sigma factor [Acidimicrobiia bacterium]